MRKVLSFVLVLAMILGSVSMAFAYTDVKSTDKCSDAVTVLSGLGVVHGYTDGAYHPENVVTRAEMATLIVTALGYEVKANTATEFSDVPATHWASGYVDAAASVGIISGYGDGTFLPDQTVSYNEAITMLVRALGYTLDSLGGTYPTAFTTMAKAIGIMDTVKTTGTAGANRGDIAMLLYDTIDQGIGTTTNKSGEYNWNYDKDGNLDTMAKRLGAKVPETAEVLTTSRAQAAIANVGEYVGAYVKVRENKDGKIVAIDEVKSTALTGELKLNGSTYEFKTVDGTTYKLSDNAATATWKVSSGATAVNALISANGEFTTATVSAMNVITKAGLAIAAKVDGKYITDLYSVFQLDDAKANVKVDADMLEEIAKDHKINGVAFEETTKDEIDMTKFALVGVDSLDEIKLDDIVTIYDDGTNVTRLEVCDKVVSGKIAKATTNDKFVIDGVTYEVEKAIAVANGDNAKMSASNAGDEVTFYLNYAGKAALVKLATEKASNFAVVLDTQDQKTGTLAGQACKVELFLADGTSKVFEVAADKVSTTTAVGTDGAWKVSAGAIVKYAVKDGVITNIISAGAVNAGTTAVTKTGYMNNLKIAKDAVVFTASNAVYTSMAAVADNNYSAKKMGVTTADKILDTTSIRATYVFDSDTKTIVALLVDDAATAAAGTFALYGGKVVALPDDEYEVSVLVVGDSTTTTMKTTVSTVNAAVTNLAAADKVAKLTFNAKGELTAANSTPTWDKTTYGAVTVGAVGTTTFTSIKLVDGKIIMKRTGGALDITTSMCALDAGKGEYFVELGEGFSIYEYSTSAAKYEKKTSLSLSNTSKGVYLYDLKDNDGICDVVVIY